MDVWKMSVTYDGTDWIIRATTEAGAHSIGLGTWKTRQFVEGAPDDLVDDVSLELLRQALIETILVFTDHLAVELMAEEVQDELPLS
jgi:hypothetical protein